MLVLPPRVSVDSSRVASAARRVGLEVLQLPGWRVDRALAGSERVTHIYAEPLFADVVAGQLGLALLEGPLDWLVTCPEDLRRRRVTPMTLREARTQIEGPTFVKAWDDKSVRPTVYNSGDELPDETLVAGNTPVLVQGVVRFTSEYRIWCADGKAIAGSRYAVEGALAEAPLQDPQGRSAIAFADEVFAQTVGSLPSGAVLDVGVTPDGWAVVEVNAAWGSGLYATPEDAALPAILASSTRADRVQAGDRCFVRQAPEVRWNE